jgi:hypothetical protein
VRDRSSLGPVVSPLGLDLDPLKVAGGLGEPIDARLIDLQPANQALWARSVPTAALSSVRLLKTQVRSTSFRCQCSHGRMQRSESESGRTADL